MLASAMRPRTSPPPPGRCSMPYPQRNARFSRLLTAPLNCVQYASVKNSANCRYPVSETKGFIMRQLQSCSGEPSESSNSRPFRTGSWPGGVLISMAGRPRWNPSGLWFVRGTYGHPQPSQSSVGEEGVARVARKIGSKVDVALLGSES